MGLKQIISLLKQMGIDDKTIKGLLSPKAGFDDQRVDVSGVEDRRPTKFPRAVPAPTPTRRKNVGRLQ